MSPSTSVIGSTSTPFVCNIWLTCTLCMKAWGVVVERMTCHLYAHASQLVGNRVNTQQAVAAMAAGVFGAALTRVKNL